MQYFNLPQDLMTTVIKLIRELKTKDDTFSFTIARIMAYRYKFEDGASDILNINSCTGGSYDKIISAVNEYLPLNLIQVREYTKKWAAWRYDQYAGKVSAPYGREGYECEDFFGLSKHFDKATLNMVKDNPTEMSHYHVKLTNLIDYLQECTGKIQESIGKTDNVVAHGL